MNNEKAQTKKNHLYNYVLAILFIQMLLFPKILMEIKLLFIIIAILLYLAGNRCRLKVNEGGIILFIYIFWNVIEIGIGILHGAGMVGVREGTTTVAWPLVFLILAGSKMNNEQLKWLYKAIVVITAILCIADITFFVAKQFGLHSIINLVETFNRNKPYASLLGGAYPAIRVDHLYFYAFLTPFMIAVLMCQKYSSFKIIGISRKFVTIVAVFSMLLAVLSGMGGIWLACMVGVLFCLLRLNRKNFRRILLLGILGGGIAFLILSYTNRGIVDGIISEVTDRISPKNSQHINEDDLVRKNQADAMVKSWTDSPLIGQGSGYPVEYYRGRTKVTETDSELMYLSILYQRGIVGIVLFFLILFYAIKILWTRKDIEWLTWPFCVGMVSFMVANTFNPYFSNMSMMWILFLPFLIDTKNTCRERYCENQ